MPKKLTLLRIGDPLATEIKEYAEAKGLAYATACVSLLHEKMRELQK